MSVTRETFPGSAFVINGLDPALAALASEIAAETNVTPSDVLIEAARDGLNAIRPRWEMRKCR